MAKIIIKCIAYIVYTVAIVFVVPAVIVIAFTTMLRDGIGDDFSWCTVYEVLTCVWKGAMSGIKESYEKINQDLGA